MAGMPAHLLDRAKMVTERWFAMARGHKVDPGFVRGVREIVIAAGTGVQEGEIVEVRRA